MAPVWEVQFICYNSTVYLGGNISLINNTVENRLPAPDNACGGGTLVTINTNIFVTGSMIFTNNSVSNIVHTKDFSCQIGGGGALATSSIQCNVKWENYIPKQSG